jgi:hypothetical protein
VSCGKVERVPGLAVDPNVVYQNGIHKNLTCFSQQNITVWKKKSLLAFVANSVKGFKKEKNVI